MPPSSTDITPLESVLPLRVKDGKPSLTLRQNANTCASIVQTIVPCPKKVDSRQGPAPVAWYSRWPFFQGSRTIKSTSNAPTSCHSDQENTPSSRLRSRRAVKIEDAAAVRRPSPMPLLLSNSNMRASQTDRQDGRMIRSAYLVSSVSQFTRQQGSGYLCSRSSMPNKLEPDLNNPRNRLSSSIHTCSREDDENSGLDASSHQLTNTVTNANGATLAGHFPISPVQIDQPSPFSEIAPLSMSSTGDARPYTSRAHAGESEVNLKLNDHPPVNAITKDETISDSNINSCQPSSTCDTENDAARGDQRLSLSPEPAVHHSDSDVHRPGTPCFISSYSQSGSQHQSYELVPDKSSVDFFLRSNNSPNLGGLANTGVPCRPKQDHSASGHAPIPASPISRLLETHPSPGPNISATEPGPFLSPEPSVFSSAPSRELSNPHSSSNSAFSEPGGRLLSQIIGAIQEDSLLSSDMDAIVENALTAYKSTCEDKVNVSKSNEFAIEISKTCQGLGERRSNREAIPRPRYCKECPSTTPNGRHHRYRYSPRTAVS